MSTETDPTAPPDDAPEAPEDQMVTMSLADLKSFMAAEVAKVEAKLAKSMLPPPPVPAMPGVHDGYDPTEHSDIVNTLHEAVTGFIANTFHQSPTAKRDLTDYLHGTVGLLEYLGHLPKL
jgi:hypothetical protein